MRYVCHGRWYQSTVYWYQPLVPETGQCDICLSHANSDECVMGVP